MTSFGRRKQHLVGFILSKKYLIWKKNAAFLSSFSKYSFRTKRILSDELGHRD